LSNRKTTEAILIHHTAGNESSMNVLRNVFKSRFGVNYVGYNRVIFPDGSVHSDIGDNGFGVHNATGKYQNYNSVGISLVGNFSNRLPGDKQLNALRSEIDRLREKYNLGRERVFGHRDLKSTACPGAKLYAWVEKYKRGEAMDCKDERINARADAMRFAWESWYPGGKVTMASIYKEAREIDEGKLKQKDLINRWRDNSLAKRYYIKRSDYTKRVNELKKEVTAADKKIAKLNQAVGDLSEQLLKCQEEKMAKTNGMKPGVRTSEFWMTLGAVVVGVLIQFDIFGDLGAVNDALVFLAQVLATMGYTYSRGIAKG
jgi:uncharacterized coiled-coil protein SlyX